MDVLPEPLRTGRIFSLILHQKYIVGLSLMLCYIIHLNQEIKVKLKCYVCKKLWFSPGILNKANDLGDKSVRWEPGRG